MRKYGFEARCTGERDYLETLAASYVEEWIAAFARADVQAGEIDAMEAPAVVAWEVLLADRGCTMEYDAEEECFWLAGPGMGGDREPFYY